MMTILALALVVTMQTSTPSVRLATAKTAYVIAGDDRADTPVAGSLRTRLAILTPLTLAGSKAQADLVLRIAAHPMPLTAVRRVSLLIETPDGQSRSKACGLSARIRRPPWRMKRPICCRHLRPQEHEHGEGAAATLNVSQREWADTSDRWLAVVFPRLRDHVRQLAQSAPGVLFVEITVEDMNWQLRGGVFRMEPTWYPAEDFARALEADRDMDPEKRYRWQGAVNTINTNAGDVAVFLHSDTRVLPIMSRLVVVQGDQPVTIH